MNQAPYETMKLLNPGLHIAVRWRRVPAALVWTVGKGPFIYYSITEGGKGSLGMLMFGNKGLEGDDLMT